MSNGGNYLGNVVIYTGGKYCSSTTITWNEEKPWPGSGGSFARNFGGIGISDNWDRGFNHLQTDSMRFDFGMTLTHEAVHYFYGLDDEYAKTRVSFLVSADPVSDKITITDNRTELEKKRYPTEFHDRLSPYVQGTPVVFFPVSINAVIPKESPGSAGGGFLIIAINAFTRETTSVRYYNTPCAWRAITSSCCSRVSLMKRTA